MIHWHFLFWKLIAFSAFIDCFNCLDSSQSRDDTQSESRLVKIDVSISNTKSKRNVEQQITMTITDYAPNESMILNFQEIHDKLADLQTPIWYSWHGAGSMPNFEHDYKTMAEVGRFRRYHDYKNKAAMIWFTDTHMVEAIVGAKYIIRNLPEFALKFPVNAKNLGQVFKRSVDGDLTLNADDDLDFSKFMKSQKFYMTKRHVESKSLGGFPRNKTTTDFEVNQGPIPDVAYPQILVVLDHSSVINQRKRNIVMSVLTYWNAVDMLYSSVSEPAVKLSIAGIVIPSDSHTTPYLDRSIDRKGRLDAEVALKFAENFFYQLQMIFPAESYDFLFVMTTSRLCGRVAGDLYCGIGGLAPNKADCSNKVDLQHTRDGRLDINIGFITTVAIVEHRNFYNSFVTAAHELAHLFSADHDDSANCTTGIMSAGWRLDQPFFEWSKCTLNRFKKYFRSNLASCLYNKP